MCHSKTFLFTYIGAGQFVFTIPKYTGRCQSVDGTTLILNAANSLSPPDEVDNNVNEDENACMNWCELEKQRKRIEGIDITGCQFGPNASKEAACIAIIGLIINSGDGNSSNTCWDLPCKIIKLLFQYLRLR